MTVKKKILFILHDASLSGAPILVLNLLKRLKQDRPDYIIDILLLKSGELYEEFVKVSNEIFVFNKPSENPSFLRRNLKRIQGIILKKKETPQDRIDKIINTLLLNEYDLVYGNTIVTLSWVLPFYKKGISTIIAIHELTFGIESVYSKEFIIENISNTTKIISGSKAVADNLIRQYGADAKRIDIVHSFVDSVLTIQKDKETLRKELHIPNDHLIVGIASAQELRKGTEMVPLLVQKIKQKTNRPFTFINLGGDSKSAAVRCAKIDAEKLDVDDTLLFIDHNKTPNDYINLFDIFLLMSREDPFPLVMLTAAKLRKPIIAFEKSGGAEEFLKNGHGILIPYLNLDIMSAEVIKLMEDSNLREKLGKNILTRLEEEYSDEKLTLDIFNLIDDLV